MADFRDGDEKNRINAVQKLINEREIAESMAKQGGALKNAPQPTPKIQAVVDELDKQMSEY